MRIAQWPELLFHSLKMLWAAWVPHGYEVIAMFSAHEYHWMPWALNMQLRQLGWARTPVAAIVAARASASVTSDDMSRNGRRPRFARALLTQPRMSDCIVGAVLAATGAGWTTQLTPVARTAPRKPMHARRRRVGPGA